MGCPVRCPAWWLWGTVYGLMSLLVRWRGIGFIKRLFSAGGDRAGYYSDRPLAGRLRCEYGKRELAVGTGSPAFRYSRLYVGPGNVEIDPYLLWNHRRVSDCESVRLDRLQACDRSSLVCISAICKAFIVVGSGYFYDSGDDCSGDRTYRRCVRNQRGDGQGFRKRSGTSPHDVGETAWHVSSPD